MAPDYTTFQTEDFILDDSFQAYVQHSDAAAMQFWQAWIAAHPTQRPVVEQAQQLIRMLSQAQPPQASTQRKEQDLQRLRRAIRTPQPMPQLRVQGLRRKRFAALAILFLLVVGAGFWLRPMAGWSSNQFATRAGEQRTVRLPDGSVVVLNGNSRLTTAATWDTEHPREVWLEGEAYFHVSHLTHQADLAVAQATGNTKFVVHAGALNVSVLGTTFNVINRSGGLNKVTLNSGKVLVEHLTLFGEEEVLMVPGELVEYSPTGHALAKRTVEPEHFSSWASGSLEFDHTPMADIIRLFQDTYGLELVVEDAGLLRQTVTGTLPNKNADVLLKALAKSLGVRTERTENKVRLLLAK
jgi:ferric-dicitrate binding protein FerR (iron transport regulator)